MPSRVFKHRGVQAVVLPMVLLSTVFPFSSPVVAQDSAGGRPAAAQSAHPFKIAASDPTALTTPDVQTETSDGHVTKDRVMGASQDGHFKSGLSSFQGGRGSIDSYPVDEFMFFLKGGVTLTSADGTALQVRAGEAVYVPKGWKGMWNTKAGYTKFYVVYDAVKAAE
jgi:ethanolamine utilization protein EutQ